MPSYTKKAIEDSFGRLLEEHPLSEITVKMIVEDCCVNRNTFYYYFQDIPAMLEEMIVNDVNKIMDRIPEEFTMTEVMDVITKYLTDKKRTILHLFNSIARDRFEVELMKLCGYAIERYVAGRQQGELPEGVELAAVSDFLKCSFFGQIIDWLNHKMSYDLTERAERNSVFIDRAIAAAME